MHAGSLAVSKILFNIQYSALYSLSAILFECAKSKCEVYAQFSALQMYVRCVTLYRCEKLASCNTTAVSVSVHSQSYWLNATLIHCFWYYNTHAFPTVTSQNGLLASSDTV